MSSLRPFFKYFIRSLPLSFFNPFVFQTPHPSDFGGQIYLIYTAQSRLALKIFTILFLSVYPFSEVSAQRLSREEAMEELYQQHIATLNLDLLTNESGEQHHSARATSTSCD